MQSKKKKNQQKYQVHKYRKQVGGGQNWGVGEMGEGGQNVQISSYNINKSGGCYVEDGSDR